MSCHKEIGTITAVGSPLSLETYWISASGIVYSVLRFNGRREEGRVTRDTKRGGGKGGSGGPRADGGVRPTITALLFDGEFRPPGQRGRPVVQEHDAARLGEGQI